MSIQTEIDRITANIAESYSVASDKGATLPDEQNSDNLADTLRSITVGGAAVEPEEKDVNFYDYDGTRLYSYTLAEAQALTELPPLPTQPGLICQEWNWDLDDVKNVEYNINIGANYTTNDGTTRIYLYVVEEFCNVTMGFGLNGTVYIDWGDNSDIDVVTGTNSNTLINSPTHLYASSDRYKITLRVEGALTIVGTNSGSNLFDSLYTNHCVNKIEIGENVALGTYAFRECILLETISIPKTVKFTSAGLFYLCRRLKNVIFPKGTTELTQNVCIGCRFRNGLITPNSIIRLKNGACSETDIQSVVLGANVTNIENQIFYNSGLNFLDLKNTKITTISTNAFASCVYLLKIDLPETVTDIASGGFSRCRRVSVFVMPDIKTIGGLAFQDADRAKFFDFTKNTSVPTLANVNAFNNLPSDCEFRVPAALYDEWIAATNWSTYADHIVAV